MKKLAIISLFTVLLAGFFTEPLLAPAVRLSNPCPSGVWVRFDFIFHKPKTNCQTGFGICVMSSWGIESNTATNPAACAGRAQINGQNQLIIEVTDDALANYEGGNTLPNFRNRNSITLEDPYTLSLAASRSLGSNTIVTIPAGTYPLAYANHTYTITIQL